MKTLRDASIGSDVVVRKLHGEGAVRGYELSIRKEDAEKIEVE